MRKTEKYDFEKVNGLFLVLVFVIFMGFFLYPMQKSTMDLKKENVELVKRLQVVEKNIDKENDRRKSLDNLRIYVQTEQYKSEVAKEKLGLLYPDEILIKPAE